MKQVNNEIEEESSHKVEEEEKEQEVKPTPVSGQTFLPRFKRNCKEG